MRWLEDGWDFMKDFWTGMGMFAFAVGMPIFIIGGLFWATSLFETPESKEKDRQQQIYERTPHVYSQVDGCTIYIWKNGSHNSYFTKCDGSNKVVTQSSHSESCGKACSKTVTEKIETN